MIFGELHDPDFSLDLGLLFLCMYYHVDLVTLICVDEVLVSEILRLNDPYGEVVNVTRILTGQAQERLISA